MRSIDELMKTRLYKVFSLTAIFIFIFSFSAFGQITSSSASGRTNNKTQEVQQTEAVVNQITDKVGILFKEGMIALKDQKRSDAGEKFNRSVEVFLLSTLNVQSNPKLSVCYNQLIETVYRMEFPATQPPNIRSLSASCEWNWSNNDFQLADEIAKLVQINPVQTDVQTNTALITSADGKINQPDQIQVGFNEQVFEPSPLDELAKLQLTQEEVNIDTPEAQQQYQYIQYAVANKSLGFQFQVHPMIQQFLNYYQGRGRKRWKPDFIVRECLCRWLAASSAKKACRKTSRGSDRSKVHGNRRRCPGLRLRVYGNLFPERAHVSVCAAQVTLMSATVLNKRHALRQNI